MSAHSRSMCTAVLSFIIIASTAVILTSAINPAGFRLVLTSKGINYILHTAVPILEAKLSSLKVPDISKSTETPIGQVDYIIQNINFENFNIPSATQKTNPSSGLTLQFSDGSVNGKAFWHYSRHSSPHIHGTGNVDISVSNVALTISAMIGRDNEGHPTLKTTSCSLSIGNVQITDHGKASWLYNLIFKDISGSITNNLQGQLCDDASNAINGEANHALETLPIITDVGLSEINYALIQPPIFTSSYIESQHKGEFFLKAKPTEAPITPIELPPVNDTDKMMYVWITEYLVNTAGYVYQESGALVYNVTADKIPSSVPIKLNTTSFKYILPNLYKEYPDMAMQLDLISTQPPSLKVNPKTVNMTIIGNMEVDVIKPDKTVVNAFVLGVTVYGSASVGIHSNSASQIISGNITLIRFDMKLVSTNIGPFSVDLLKDTVSGIVDVFVLPLANKYTNGGITIPMFDGVTFTDPQLTLGQGYVMVSTDVSYKPSYW